MQRGNKINTAKHTVRHFPAGVSSSASYAANPQFAVIFYFFGKKIPVPLQIYPFSPLQYRLKSYIIGGRNRSVRFSDGFGRFFFLTLPLGGSQWKISITLKKLRCLRSIVLSAAKSSISAAGLCPCSTPPFWMSAKPFANAQAFLMFHTWVKLTLSAMMPMPTCRKWSPTTSLQ